MCWLADFRKMAGMAGLEPADAGVKVPCLTDLATSHYRTDMHNGISSAKRILILGSTHRRQPAAGAAMGWVIGLEPMTPRATTWYSNQLSYTHHIAEKMVRLKGLEPPTHCLEGSCSIHLSYRRIYLDISSSVSHWSGRWESNPRYQLGRLEFYH